MKKKITEYAVLSNLELDGKAYRPGDTLSVKEGGRHHALIDGLIDAGVVEPAEPDSISAENGDPSGDAGKEKGGEPDLNALLSDARELYDRLDSDLDFSRHPENFTKSEKIPQTDVVSRILGRDVGAAERNKLWSLTGVHFWIDEEPWLDAPETKPDPEPGKDSKPAD